MGWSAAAAAAAAAFGATQMAGGPDTIAPPAIPAPAVMPTPDDAAAKLAKKRSLAAEMARSGRASTILSGMGGAPDPLGG